MSELHTAAVCIWSHSDLSAVPLPHVVARFLILFRSVYTSMKQPHCFILHIKKLNSYSTYVHNNEKIKELKETENNKH